MPPLVKTIYSFIYWSNAWTTSWPRVLLFLRWLLKVQSNSHSSGGPREDNIYLSFWDFCLSPNTFWFIQCPRDILTLYVKLILRYGRMMLRDFYRWFLHLWRLILPMSLLSWTCPKTMYWKEFDFKLGKIPLYGAIWDCPRSWNI